MINDSSLPIPADGLQEPQMHFRIYVESLGCAGNRTDGERIRRLYAAAGWIATSEPGDADILILQTCGFTRYQEDVNLQRIRELQALSKPDARLLVGGCLPSINPTAVRRLHNGPTFGPRTLHRAAIPLAAEHRLEDVPAFSPSVEEPGTATVRVSTGCLDHCSFCAIPYANGRIRSRSAEDVAADVIRAHAEGLSRIHLVAEDIGAWGRDVGARLVDLLDHLLNLPVDVDYQIDNLNPNWVVGDLPTLLARLAEPRILKRFYVPVQSGSDDILRRMRRRYTVSQVRNVFEALRQRFPKARFSSDFVVGFPGETEEDFEATRSLLLDLDLDFASIYAYEERPRTPAARFPDQVPADVRQQRARILIAEMVAIEATRRGFVSVDQVLRMVRERMLPINTNVRQIK
jgi:tRNA-2-methylthio-N6-dimethylallyladenosine synthase